MFGNTSKDKIYRRGKAVASLIEKGKMDDNTFSTFEIDVPMKSQGDRVDTVKAMKEEIHSQYATAYLQKIGALPTPANVAMVQQNKPLDACDVFPAWKTAGWPSDSLKVRPFSNFAKGGLAQRRAAIAKALDDDDRDELEKHNAESNGFDLSREGDGTGPHLLPAGQEEEEHMIGHTRCTIAAMKKKYVYPFNASGPGMDDVLERLSRAPDTTRSRGTGTRSEGGGRGGEGGGGGGGGGGGDPVLDVGGRSSDSSHPGVGVVLQLRRPLRILPKDISVAQKDFVLAFPFKDMAGRLGTKTEKSLRQLLLSLSMTRLIGLLCHYLYWRILRAEVVPLETMLRGELGGQSHIRFASVEQSSLSASEMDDLKTSLLMAFGELELKLRDSVETIAFHRPLVLLSLRVISESILQSEYPLWFEFEDTALAELVLESQEDPSARRKLPLSTAEKIDSVVAALFDPNRLGSRLAPLESTLSALQMAMKSKRFCDHTFRHRSFAAPGVEATLKRVMLDTGSIGRDPFSDPLRETASPSPLSSAGRWTLMETVPLSGEGGAAFDTDELVLRAMPDNSPTLSGGSHKKKERHQLPTATDVGTRRSLSTSMLKTQGNDAIRGSAVTYPKSISEMAHTTSSFLRHLYPAPRDAATRYMFARARGIKAGGETAEAPAVNELKAGERGVGGQEEAGGGGSTSSVRHGKNLGGGRVNQAVDEVSPRVRVENQRQLYRLAMDRLHTKYHRPTFAHQKHRLDLLRSLEEYSQLGRKRPKFDDDSDFSELQAQARESMPQRRYDPPSVPASASSSRRSSEISSAGSAARLMILRRQQSSKSRQASQLDEREKEREERVDQLLRSIPRTHEVRSPFAKVEDTSKQGRSFLRRNRNRDYRE